MNLVRFLSGNKLGWYHELPRPYLLIAAGFFNILNCINQTDVFLSEIDGKERKTEMKRHVLSILVNDYAGVLSRVAGLFSRRGYNIDSLSVGETETLGVSRITVVVICDDDAIEQIIKQVEKLIDVRRVVDMTTRQAVFRELALIKVGCTGTNRGEIVSIADIYRANIIDVATESMTIEITGNQNKIESFIMLMEPYGVKEIVRTGLTALCRGNNPIKNFIKQELE